MEYNLEGVIHFLKLRHYSMHQKSTAEQQLETITLFVTLRWLLAALIDWAIIIGAMWFAVTGGEWWMYLIALFVVGNRIQGLALLGHEGAHYMVSKNKVLNDFLTNIFTFYAYGFNVEPYRHMHIKHHEYLGSQLDPELDEKRKTATAWDLPMSRKDMIVQFLRDCSFGAVREELSFVSWLGKPKSKVDFAIHLAWYGVVLGSLYMLGGFMLILKVVLIWEIAVATTFWAMFRLRMYTEHMGNADAYRIKASWWAKLFFLPHNTWYHWEHHYNYNVPFFRLPKLRKLNPRPEVEVRQLSDVFASYATMPRIESGTPLRDLPLDGSVKVEM